MLLAKGLVPHDGRSDLRVTVLTPTPAGECNDETLPFQVVRQPGLASVVREIRQADVIHLAGPCLLPMLLGLVFRKMVVVEHHGYQAVCPNGLLLCEPSKTVCPGHFVAHRYHKCLSCNAVSVGWIKSLVALLLAFPRRWLCAMVTRNLPITEHVKGRISLPQSVVIYYGIPDPVGTAPDTEQCPSCPTVVDPPVTFAYVGRLVSEKGLHLLVEAAQQLRGAGYDFAVKFIGDGPERPRLQGRINTLGLGGNAVFTGYLQRAALQSALTDVAAVVMPSIWEETAGLSAMEQMMRGRLVIAADIGGLGEVVGEAGLKFPSGDVGGLASCMKRVLDDPALVNLLGKEARQRALRLFRVERMVADHIALYRQISCLPSTKPLT